MKASIKRGSPGRRSRRGRQGNRWTPPRGARTRPPPTITRCRRFSSPTPKPPRSDCRAEQAGHRARVVDVETGDVVMGAKLYADGYTGRARMVVDVDHGYLLGVTMVGPGVSELLHSAPIAVAGRVPIDRLWHAVPCFPTISEVWLRLLEAYRDSSA